MPHLRSLMQLPENSVAPSGTAFDHAVSKAFLVDETSYASQLGMALTSAAALIGGALNQPALHDEAAKPPMGQSE